MKKLLGLCSILISLSACGNNGSAATDTEPAQDTVPAAIQSSDAKNGTVSLIWDDLMPEGEDARLAELYSEFYEEMETRMRQQMTLADAAKADDANITDLISEGSAQDTMEQIGTYNVVEDLNGQHVRIPGYIVPLDFSATSEHGEFLLVPYFGACLHTPPPPPNQIVYVKASPAAKVPNIYDPVWLEGTMTTGKFTSDLANTAYELSLSKLEPYEY